MASKRRSCPQCGEVKLLQWNQITCSMACRIARASAARLAAAPIGVCAVCEQEGPLLFTARTWRVCSKRCRMSASTTLYRTGRVQPRYPKRSRPAEQVCEACGKTYPPRRYDQRFCSLPCNDRWQDQFGQTGVNRRLKERARLARAAAEIGYCRLCGVTTEHLVPLAAFGGSRMASGAFYHRDHVLPRSRGGTDAPENLRWVCWFCNYIRGNMGIEHDDLIAAAGRAFWEAHRRRA